MTNRPSRLPPLFGPWRLYWASASCIAGSSIPTTPLWGGGDRQSGRREAVDLAVAGGGYHPAVVGHRHPDGIAGGRRQRIAVDRVPVGRIEDQQRHPGRTVVGRTTGHGVADA